jgi:lactoylglutathione lyase
MSDTSSPPGGSTSAEARPFRVLGLQQIAIGGPSKTALRGLWVDLFGVPAIHTFRSERENVDEDILSLAGVEIDLMQPIDPAGKPKVHEPALNHIGLWVDDLPGAVEWLTAKGVRFASGGIRKGAAGYDICFIHPKGSEDAPHGGEGVLIELVQAPLEIVEAFQAMSKSRMVYVPDLNK